MTKKQQQIMSVWDSVEDMYPDKSTEFLIKLTVELTGASYGAVIDALHASIKEKEKKNA